MNDIFAISFSLSILAKWITVRKKDMAYSLKEALLMLPAIAATVNGFLFTVRKGSEGWTATDWYISNDFGFVRRGLMGGLLRQVSEQVGGLDINIFASSITAIALLMLSAVTIINSRDLPLINRFAIVFSPAFYTLFVLLEPNASGRKEALSILLIMSYALSKKLQGWRKDWVGVCSVVVGLPVITLIHESNFLFSLPILLFLLLMDVVSEAALEPARRLQKVFVTSLIRKLSLLVPGFLAFFFAYLYSSPDPVVVQNICASWQSTISDLGCNPLPAALGALADQPGYSESIRLMFGKPQIYVQIAYSFI